MVVSYFIGDCGKVDAFDAGFEDIEFSQGEFIELDGDRYKVESLSTDEAGSSFAVLVISEK